MRDAAELRIKETDRIRTVVENLRRMGVEAEELPDGMAIPAGRNSTRPQFDSFGDHRIAMAFAVARSARRRRIRRFRAPKRRRSRSRSSGTRWPRLCRR